MREANQVTHLVITNRHDVVKFIGLLTACLASPSPEVECEIEVWKDEPTIGDNGPAKMTLYVTGSFGAVQGWEMER
jgi:hypothetical protein